MPRQLSRLQLQLFFAQGEFLKWASRCFACQRPLVRHAREVGNLGEGGIATLGDFGNNGHFRTNRKMGRIDSHCCHRLLTGGEFGSGWFGFTRLSCAGFGHQSFSGRIADR